MLALIVSDFVADLFYHTDYGLKNAMMNNHKDRLLSVGEAENVFYISHTMSATSSASYKWPITTFIQQI